MQLLVLTPRSLRSYLCTPARLRTTDAANRLSMAASGFPKRPDSASGSAYRGSNPWGAAKLSAISCIRPLRIFGERSAKRSYCTSNGLVLKKHCWWERLRFYLQSRLAAK
jgi:hypothetical protein